MHFNVFNRRVHYWAAFATAVPLLVIIVTGLLLQMKKYWTWVQPAEQRGSGTAPVVSLEDVLSAVQGVPCSSGGGDGLRLVPSPNCQIFNRRKCQILARR